MQEMQEKYEHYMKAMQEQINQIMLMVQQNPKLAQVKPEVLTRKNIMEQ
jgi:hypothetical protein